MKFLKILDVISRAVATLFAVSIVIFMAASVYICFRTDDTVYEIHEPVTYPDTTTEEWKNMTLGQRQMKCKLLTMNKTPKMDTYSLVVTTITYPLFDSGLAYSTLWWGDWVWRGDIKLDSNEYKYADVVARPDAISALTKYLYHAGGMLQPGTYTVDPLSPPADIYSSSLSYRPDADTDLIKHAQDLKEYVFIRQLKEFFSFG